MNHEESKSISNNNVNAWDALRKFTNARIGLGRTGSAILTKDMLAFRSAHARARDAVFSALDVGALSSAMDTFSLPVFSVSSAAQDRSEYLHRPDNGRRLSNASEMLLANAKHCEREIVIIVADGLSASAVMDHTMPLLQSLVPRIQQSGLTVSAIVIAQQARVALSDVIGSQLKARLVLMLIGERPGLSTPDSLGVYLTYAPAPGLTDASRNCVSNIHPRGLSFEIAAEKIHYLVRESLRRKLSGIALKDNSGLLS